MRPPTRLFAATLLALSSCVQIDTERSVTTHPLSGEPARVIGSVSTQIVARGTVVRWTQRANVLELSVASTPQCKRVEHHPVERVTTVDRTVRHGGLYIEYATAAAALGLGLAALIRPQAFSPNTVSQNGEVRTDNATGYRIGGIFTTLGAAGLGIAIYDTKRSRDTTSTTRAYAVQLGDTVDCAQVEEPSAGADVELVFGSWKATGRSNAEGVVTFSLPPEDTLDLPFDAILEETREPLTSAEGPAELDKPSATAKPAAMPEPDSAPEQIEAPEMPPPAPPPAQVEREAEVRLPSGLTVPVVFVAPYGATAAAERSGSATLPAKPIADTNKPSLK